MKSFPLLTGLSFLILPFHASALEFVTDTFSLNFGNDGRPESCQRTSDGLELLSNNPERGGFHFKSPDGSLQRMPNLAMQADGRLMVGSADGTKKIFFKIKSGRRYLELRVDAVEGMLPEQFESFFFEIKATPKLRVLELDYMTVAENRSFGVTAEIPELWHHSPQDPKGGFVLYDKTDDGDEDETLLRLWVEEKLPHPKVSGEWTVDSARAWLKTWQSKFADRTQFILAAKSQEELRQGLDLASRIGIKQIYLFTDTWRPEPFWPVSSSNWSVNTKVFPRGEEDLKEYAGAVRAKGMTLALHYLSGGIGMKDPNFIGQKPDRQLASWGTGKLVGKISNGDQTLNFQPTPGVELPQKRPLPYPVYSETNWMRLGDEIIRIGSIEARPDGSWQLKGCRRGQGSTTAVDHPDGEECAGLFAAYGTNFIPDNDSPLLAEMAGNYAGLLNRCGVEHAEFDGAEIHTHDGQWGYRKFAQLVYEALDHPTTAHESSGARPRAWFEYRLNSSQRLMAGSCSYTHGNYSVPVGLASPSRPATSLLDAHFALSQGNLGGALGISKPEPLFGVSLQDLQKHGLGTTFLETLVTWKEVCARLGKKERDQINSTFAVSKTHRSLVFNQHLMSPVVPVARKVKDNLEIVPTRVLTRATGDIQWQNAQEYGPVAPRQFIKPGETLTLQNPDPAQALQCILHVLPALNPKADFVAPKPAQSAASKTGTDVFTAGNSQIEKGAVKPSGNISLQPGASATIHSGSGSILTIDNGILSLTHPTIKPFPVRELKNLPGWSVDADLSSNRGLGMWVTGDASGAILLVQVGQRDYVVPIDFADRRYVEIPNGEVSWAMGQWGWRMETKSNHYESVRQVRIGIGQTPRGLKANIKVEELTALGETAVALVNPVVRVGAGQARIRGTVPSGFYLQLNGTNSAQLFDENWQPKGSLPVEKGDLSIPKGQIEVGVLSEQKGLLPWLDVQFITVGQPILISGTTTPGGSGVK